MFIQPIFQSKVYNSTPKNNYQSPAFLAAKPNLRQVRIKNSPVGYLPEDTQKIIKQILDQTKKIKEFFDNLKTKPIKSSKIRKDYPKLIKRQQGLSFKNEDGEIVTVLKSRNPKNELLRFVIENGESTKQHILIDIPDKIVKNVDISNPFMTPNKLRYMTPQELEQSPVEKHAKFAKTELDEYINYLENYDKIHPQKRKSPTKKVTNDTAKPNTATKAQSQTPAPAKVPTPATVQLAQVLEAPSHPIDEIFNIFDSQNKKMLDHVKTTVSPRTGQIIALNLKTSDGGTLMVSKKVSAESKMLQFLSFKKTNPDGKQEFLNLDYSTKQFIETNVFGKPKIEDGIINIYSPEEAAERGLFEKYDNFMSEILNNSSKNTEAGSVEVLAEKKARRKKFNLDTIKIEDYEDKKLNALLDNENSIN